MTDSITDAELLAAALVPVAKAMVDLEEANDCKWLNTAACYVEVEGLGFHEFDGGMIRPRPGLVVVCLDDAWTPENEQRIKDLAEKIRREAGP